MPQRHDNRPTDAGRTIGKVVREAAKPCKWCDDPAVDYRLQCGNETVWACVLHVDQLEVLLRRRHARKYAMLWAKVV